MGRLGTLIWRYIFESGDAKRLEKQTQDLSDLIIDKDIAYLSDGDRGHLLDIYSLPGTDGSAPVLINIHGGGLFASYKEVNANFNYEWARLGYRVVSLSYRRIPETTLWHQIDDVMAALRFIKANADGLGLGLDRCVITGDSAGALLCLFAMAIEGSGKLQEIFGIRASGIPFRAAGLISIMLDTQRSDLMSAINSVITDETDEERACLPYLLDPASMLRDTVLPPAFLVTSAEDLIRKDTIKFRNCLKERGFECTLKDFAKGGERKLPHVFTVMYPMYPESREVFSGMDAYFRKNTGDGPRV